MENKQPKRRWKIPVLLVSVICILLASSFVFHTTAEAAMLSYSLNGATFTMPMENDGSLSNVGLDASLISDYSVTSSNQYASDGMYDSGSLEEYTGTPVYVSQMPDCKYAVYNSGTITLYKTYGVETITPIASSDPYGGNPLYYVIPGYYATPNNYGAAIVSYDGQTVYSFSSSSSYYYQVLGFFYLNSRYYLVVSNISAFRVYVLSESFTLLQNIVVFNGKGTDYYACCLYGDDILIGTRNSILVLFDTNTNTYQSYDFSSDRLEFYSTSLISDGSNIFLFKGSSFYSLDLSSTTCVRYSLPLSFSANYITRAWFCLETIYVSGSSGILKLSKSNSYYFDFGTYAANYIQNAKYVNFSVTSSTSVNGGDVVGVKLDFGLSSEYLSTLTAYGLRLTGCTMLASIDDPSAVSVNFGYSPIVVKVNGTVVPRNSTSYDLIEEYNGVYLYSFVSSVDFQGSTKISSLEVYLNCYIPEQLSKHSFSLPVSPIELYLEPSGGGGGESPDTSSGGGGGESSDTSSGGSSSGTSLDSSSEDVSSPDVGEFLRFYYVDKTGSASFAGFIPLANVTKISAFMGGYQSYRYANHSTYEPVMGYLVINFSNKAPEIIRFDFVIQAWSKYSGLGSFHYPLFSGTLIEIDFTNTDALYFTDAVPYGQARVCDYDGFTYALVNFPSADSYLTVKQDTSSRFEIFVAGGGYQYIAGKLARYKKVGFNVSTSWEEFELDSSVSLTCQSLRGDGYTTLVLQTYSGVYPPFDPDFEQQLYEESLKRQEIENAVNSAYGTISFDPQDTAEFGDAILRVEDAYHTSGANYLFGIIGKMWSVNPAMSWFVAITCTCAITIFFVRKL